MEKWLIAEAESSVEFNQLSDFPTLLCFLYYVSLSIAQYGWFTANTIALLCAMGLFRGLMRYMRSIGNLRVQFWLVAVLCQIGQVTIYCQVLFDPRESFTASIVNSTVVLVIWEISPIHSLGVNGLLLTKHIAMWVLVAERKGVPGEVLTLIPTMWCYWMLLYSQVHKRKLLTAKQRAEEQKDVEERRLRALLYALPDGVLVLAETLQVLTCNPAARLQFGWESAQCESAVSLLTTLAYDPDYLRSSQVWVATFEEDVKRLLEEKEGVVKSFQPVLLEGRHLECRGCVTKWDETKVLVLTIRDTSNWAELEKAAQRDSANKTTLIRSVSHELRTPVNAIINLCQDLQSSTALGERDRADIEVLANASTFLLSMINDLLDYSRILHGKFTLVKANFDLEHLIRTCGALIALQCKQKQVEFLVRFDSLLPKFAYTDENRLKQVILNLLSNAAK